MNDPAPSQDVRPRDAWVIEPRNPGLLAQVREIWRYRHLFRFFAVRALRKRYARTILGVGWLFIRPLFPVAVAAFVFGNVLGVQAEVPFFLFLVVSMAHWRAFAATLMWSTRSIEINRGMVKRLYFPRLILPIATMAPGFLDLAVYAVTIVGVGIYFYATSDVFYLQGLPTLLWAMLSVGLTFLFTLGVGLFTSIFGAQTRDMRWSLRYVLNGWMLLTPVMYPVDRIPENMRWTLIVNPLASLVETFKYGVLGIGEIPVTGLLFTASLSVVLLAFGLRFFNNADATSADRL